MLDCCRIQPVNVLHGAAGVGEAGAAIRKQLIGVHHPRHPAGNGIELVCQLPEVFGQAFGNSVGFMLGTNQAEIQEEHQKAQGKYAQSYEYDGQKVGCSQVIDRRKLQNPGSVVESDLVL